MIAFQVVFIACLSVIVFIAIFEALQYSPFRQSRPVLALCVAGLFALGISKHCWPAAKRNVPASQAGDSWDAAILLLYTALGISIVIGSAILLVHRMLARSADRRVKQLPSNLRSDEQPARGDSRDPNADGQDSPRTQLQQSLGANAPARHVGGGLEK